MKEQRTCVKFSLFHVTRVQFLETGTGYILNVISLECSSKEKAFFFIHIITNVVHAQHVISCFLKLWHSRMSD